MHCVQINVAGVLPVGSQQHPKPQQPVTQTQPNAQAWARAEFCQVDALLVPTAVHHYTLPEIASQEEAPGQVPALLLPGNPWL